MANKLRASGQIQDKDRYISVSEAKKQMVAMLTEIKEVAWKHHSHFDDDIDFEVDKAVEDIVNYIDKKISELEEQMTEQTITAVRAEATKEEAERWKAKIRALHNDLAFEGDTVDTHWVCHKLYELLK